MIFVFLCQTNFTYHDICEIAQASVNYYIKLQGQNRLTQAMKEKNR